MVSRALFALFFVAQLVNISGAPQGKSVIEEIIQEYNRATEQRDSDLMGQLLHQKATHYVVTPAAEQPLFIATENYLALLSGGRIGGVNRTLKIEEVEASGEIAHVRAVFGTPAADFIQHFGLIRHGEQWKIVSVVAQMVTK